VDLGQLAQSEAYRRRIERVENIFLAALREREFDEVERIVRRNRQRPKGLPPRASSALFKPEMVKALSDSHSFVHLELLADLKLLDSLENRHGAIGAVVRELLRSEASPLRSAVLDRYGGLEHNVHSAEHRALIEKTFQNPEWYFQSSAHYPLVISAMEALRSGKLDAEYNSSGRDYEARQGTSRRANCPIYLAAGAEALAIEAALEQRVERDFYSTDLFQIFVAVQEKSSFDEKVWSDPRNNGEFPTPFAYLLHTITSHLEDLSRLAIRQATSSESSIEDGAPGDAAEQIVRSWSVCVWSIADSVHEVSPDFRLSIIRQYLVFMLQLGWEISEVYLSPIPSNVEDLDAWRDLFLAKLRSMLHPSDHVRWYALQEAVESLDHGKRYVSGGYEWLQNSLVS
jgi:hypothetical protein